MPRMNTSLKPMSQSENLLRHPSAEDLDAAHQLVSSARGARERAAETRRESQGSANEDVEMGNSGEGDGDGDGDGDENKELTPGTSATEQQQAQGQGQGQSQSEPPAPTSNSGAPSQHKSPRSPGRDAAFLGHSCRFVALFT